MIVYTTRKRYALPCCSLSVSLKRSCMMDGVRDTCTMRTRPVRNRGYNNLKTLFALIYYVWLTKSSRPLTVHGPEVKYCVALETHSPSLLRFGLRKDVCVVGTCCCCCVRCYCSWWRLGLLYVTNSCDAQQPACLLIIT